MCLRGRGNKMVDQEILMNFARTFSTYGWLISFLAPIIGGGELGIMVVAFVAAQGYFPIWVVVLFSFLGMITTDSIWFMIMRLKLIRRAQDNSERFQRISQKVNTLSGGRDMLILLISKILVGTRILIITYISSRRISFGKFTLYNTPPTFIWAILLCFFGWLAGKGYYNLMEIYGDVKIAITFVVVFGIAIYLAGYYIRRWLMRRRKKLL